MQQPTPASFFERLKWIDGRPLVDTIEPYRRALFDEALKVENDVPVYSMVLAGRGKKNWKTADLILALLYKLLAWQSPQGNDVFIIANDEGQAADDLDLAKKIVQANAMLRSTLHIHAKQIKRKDGRGAMTILPARDVLGSHGKTYLACGFDEIHGYRNHDLFEALAPDPTRQDVLTWVTSYASLYGAGTPLHDLIAAGKRGTDKRMLFSWYSADYCTDAIFGNLDDAELRANPSIGSWPQGRAYLEQQKARLPRHKYRRLHLNLPGMPEGAAFSADNIMDAVVTGRKRLSPNGSYDPSALSAHVDMSAGSNDDAVLAIAGKIDGKIVLHLIEKQSSGTPFNPQNAIRQFAAVLKRWSLSHVTLDRFATNVWVHAFAEHDITASIAPRTTHEHYSAFEPLLNAGEVELLDHPTLIEQLLGLVWRGKKIDHASGEHDDHAAAACAAITSAAGGATVSSEAMSYALECNQQFSPMAAARSWPWGPDEGPGHVSTIFGTWK